MPPENFTGQQNTITIAQGKKGSGKTNAVKVETEIDQNIYYIDIRNEYNHVRKVTNKTEFFRDVMAAQHGRIEATKVSRVSFTFNNRHDYIELFEFFKNVENVTIVFDEADTLFNDRKMERPLVDIMLGARNHNVNLYYCSKRPFLIPINVRSQVDKYLVFRTNEVRDVDYIKSNVRKEFPKSPHTLKQGQCLVIIDGNENPIEVKQYEKYIERVKPNE